MMGEGRRRLILWCIVEMLFTEASLAFAPRIQSRNVHIPTVRRMPCRTRVWSTGKSDRTTTNESRDPQYMFDEERRSELFQYLLRDLQIEGVPLLSVDADQPYSMQAAIWTTMAELFSSQASLEDKDQAPRKLCLILEAFSVDTIRIFVDEFNRMKSLNQCEVYLPEFSLLHLALVGNGLGPAIIVEVREPDPTWQTSTQGASSIFQKLVFEEYTLTAAMKMFVDRVVPNCLDERVPPTYRVSGFSDAFHQLSSFWNAVCELNATPIRQRNTIFLLFPSGTPLVTETIVKDELQRFVALAEVLLQFAKLCQGDSGPHVQFFHPCYDRELIDPVDQYVDGHLPPSCFTRQLLLDQEENRTTGTEIQDCITKLSQEDLQHITNYLRRSPVPAVAIRYGGDDDDDDYSCDQNVPHLSRSLIHMIEEGRAALQSKLEGEIDILR